MKSTLHIQNLKKYYGDVKAVDGVSFNVDPGELLVIIGSSGSGKSTIMRCIKLLVEVTEGKIHFEDKEITHLRGKEKRETMREIGMIFQNYNLVERLTVFQNVMHGRLGYVNTLDGVFGRYDEESKKKALKILTKIGMEETIYKRAGELSGGQMQRVGIARAFMQNPKLLLCDEPIASLDPNTSRIIMDLIRDLAKEAGIAAIVNLHQVHVAKEYATRIIGIKQGKLVFDGHPHDLTDEMIEQIYDSPIEELSLDLATEDRKHGH